MDAFYYTMKIVSVSVFTDFSQFQFIRNVKWKYYYKAEGVSTIPQ